MESKAPCGSLNRAPSRENFRLTDGSGRLDIDNDRILNIAAIQGNFAIYSGLKLTSAFALEKMTMPYINVVAVKRDNAESKWAQDIVTAYRSPTFKTAILSNRFYDGFTLPDYLR